VWFVITPDIGIETEAGTAADAQIYQLIDHFHARLVVASHDVFVLKWRPGRDRTSFEFSNNPSIPTWILTNPYHFHRPSGPAPNWHVSSSKSGDVVSGNYWFLDSRAFTATVRYSSSRALEAQLWDDSTGSMLKQATLPPTGGAIEIRAFSGRVLNRGVRVFQSGSGIFQLQSAPPPSGDILELRIVSRGSTKVSVYSLSVAGAREHH
jgi:hypothetical protein